MSSHQNSISREDLIQQHADLFWYIPESDKSQISNEVLVEFILNYGNADAVKGLFDVLGIEQVSVIFQQLIAHERVNLFPPVINYFQKYFEKHVH
ncbi:MAG TPA: hypothetical protein VJ946_00920 [Bacteroidales bacterium]|nr:hypothetical protein [Bacteroidales bacterium]